MRRLLFVSLSLVVTATVAIGSPASAQRAAPCPVAQPACCPPVQCCLPPDGNAPDAGPQPVCCLGGAQPSDCAARITIASSPDPSTATKRVKITGRLIAPSGVGVLVELWEKAAGQHAFHQVAHTTTNSSGRYRFVRRASINRAWYVSADGAVSATIHQHVRDLISLAWFRKGKRVALSGSVTPSHGGERIALQEQTASGWVTIATARLGKGSGFGINFSVTKLPDKLRLVLGADRRNIRTVSRFTVS